MPPIIPKILEKYIQHHRSCDKLGNCVCGHPFNNHFDFDNRVCAHCSFGNCPGYTRRPCTCGLDDILTALGMKIKLA